MTREVYVLLAVAAVTLCAYALLRLATLFEPAPGPDQPRGRGRFLVSEVEMQRLADAHVLQTGDRAVAWFGEAALTAAMCNSSFTVIGSTGSGKSTLIRGLLMDALRSLAEGGLETTQRVVVHDAKQGEYLSFLDRLGLSESVMHLNPFAKDNVYSWDLATDLEAAPAAISDVLTGLIPLAPGEKQPHFVLGARRILADLFRTLLRRVGADWDLGDVVVACRDKSTLASILMASGDPDAIATAKNHVIPEFGETSSVLSTLSVALSQFQLVLGPWRENYLAGRRFSVSAWRRGETSRSILVLGQSTNYAAASRPVTAATLNFLFSDLLSEPVASGYVRTWAFLDELALLGKCEILRRVQDTGRSAALSVVLGTQSVETVKAEWGSDAEVDAVLGGSENFALLQMQSPKSRAWAEQLIGRQEILQRDVSTSTTSQPGRPDSIQRSEREATREQPAVMASELSELPKPSSTQPLVGFYLTRLGCWKSEMPPSKFPPEAVGAVDYVDADTINQAITWSSPDLPYRLGVDRVDLDPAGETSTFVTE